MHKSKKMRQCWDTVRPASRFKTKDHDNNHQKKEVLSLVKECIKQILNLKKRKQKKYMQLKRIKTLIWTLKSKISLKTSLNQIVMNEILAE
jgi:predicted ArsR family transcriptional regulator